MAVGKLSRFYSHADSSFSLPLPQSDLRFIHAVGIPDEISCFKIFSKSVDCFGPQSQVIEAGFKVGARDDFRGLVIVGTKG